MDYSGLVRNLTAEMKKGVQYKRLPTLFKLLIIIAMIPLIISFVISKLFYWVTFFVYKMLAAPAEYLHQWLRSQKDEVQHATQAVLYLVCLPTIFSLQVLISFNSLVFFFQWFSLMIQGYLLTLGGIKFQPFITEVSFEDEDREYDCAPGMFAVSIFSFAAVGSLGLYILVAVIMSFVDQGGFRNVLQFMSSLFCFIYAVVIYVVNPCLFKRVPKKVDAEEYDY